MVEEQTYGAAELNALLGTRSDDELNQEVATLGTDTVLARAFQGMQQAFNPDKASGQSAVIQYVVNAADGPRNWIVSVANGTCDVSQGQAPSPRVTLTIGLADFLRLLAGKLDAMAAFMGGKLKVTGDIMFANTMQSWFPRR